MKRRLSIILIILIILPLFNIQASAGEKIEYYLDVSVIKNPQYSYVGEFRGGFAKVRKGSKWGIISSLGKIIVPIEYSEIDIYRKLYKGRAFFKVYQGKKTGLFNQDGKCVLKPILCSYLDLNKDVFLVIKKGNSRAFTYDGRLLFATKYDRIYPVYNKNYYYTYIGSRRGIIDLKGHVIVPASYKGIITYKNFIAAYKNSASGLYSYDGKCILKTDYDYIIPRRDKNLFIVSKDGEYGVITLKGKRIVPAAKYESIETSDKMVIVRREADNIFTEYAFDMDGKQVLKTEKYHLTLYKELIRLQKVTYEGEKRRVAREFYVRKAANRKTFLNSNKTEKLFVQFEAKGENEGFLGSDNKNIYFYNKDLKKVRTLHGFTRFNVINESIISAHKYKFDKEKDYSILDYMMLFDRSLKKIYDKKLTSAYSVTLRKYNENNVKLDLVYIQTDESSAYLDKEGRKLFLPFVKGYSYCHFTKIGGKYYINRNNSQKYSYENLYTLEGKKVIRGLFNSLSAVNYLGKPCIKAYKSGLGYKLYDLNGKPIINSYYDSITGYKSADIYMVGNHSKYGWTDKYGKVVLKPQFDSVEVLPNDTVIATKNKLHYAYTTAGKKINKKGYELVSYINKDNYKFKVEDKYGIFNTSGKILLNPKYSSIGRYTYNICRVRQGTFYGYINTSQVEVLPTIYDNADSRLTNGFGIIEKGGYQGAINSTGKIIIPVKYDNLRKVKSWPWIAETVQNGKVGLFYLGGKEYKTPRFDDVLSYYYGIKRVKVGIKWGIMMPDGDMLVKPKYDYISSLNGIGFAYANVGGMVTNHYVKGGKWGLIGRDGRCYIEPTYDKLRYIGEGTILTEKDGKFGFVRAKWHYRTIR